MKDAVLRAAKISALPMVLQGLTPNELATALVQRGGPKLQPDDIEAAVVDARAFLTDAAASLDALIARFEAAKTGA